MTVFWVDGAGSVLVATADEDEGPPGAVKVTKAPPHGGCIWNGASWDDPGRPERDPTVIDVVEALKRAGVDVTADVVLAPMLAGKLS